MPDGGAVFTKPDDGWYYVINSGQWNRDSGVFVFNSVSESKLSPKKRRVLLDYTDDELDEDVYDEEDKHDGGDGSEIEAHYQLK